MWATRSSQTTATRLSNGIEVLVLQQYHTIMSGKQILDTLPSEKVEISVKLWIAGSVVEGMGWLLNPDNTLQKPWPWPSVGFVGSPSHTLPTTMAPADTSSSEHCHKSAQAISDLGRGVGQISVT